MLRDAITLPSGAELRVQVAPFALARDLYQAMLKALGVTQLGAEFEVSNVLKDLFIKGFASKEIEKYVWDCFKTCTYNDTKIDKDTFEGEENRQDYIKCIIEVVAPNVAPFFKSLFAEYAIASAMINSIQKPK